MAATVARFAGDLVESGASAEEAAARAFELFDGEATRRRLSVLVYGDAFPRLPWGRARFGPFAGGGQG